ncbi:MAG: threonine synthase [Clostridia bacterium]|nr:threonine synthase [Clostridia bacterium]
MKYNSTRGGVLGKTASQAIIKGIAEDKGLYVPESFPQLSSDWEDVAKMDYLDVAKLVLKPYLSEFDAADLAYCIEGAYIDKFEKPDIAPLVAAGGVHFIELFHGKTAAFKDMALSLLPYLLTTSIQKEKEDKKIAILAATSGDTGIAAIKGFEDVPGTEIIVFYPEEGVSAVQKQQMKTADGQNVHVAGVTGNFDDAQTGVKNILNNVSFASEALSRGYKVTAANSINIGRLLPQIVYYVWAYAKLVSRQSIKSGDAVNIVVPSGNFGNLLSAYYAKMMGVPVHQFICASNKNNILTEFFKTGTYDAQRELYCTNAPSMDIIISSNLERLLYHLSGEDGALISSMMDDLEKEKKYVVNNKIRMQLKDFYGGFATEEEIEETIAKVYRKENYLIDTHTATGYKVYLDYFRETGDVTPTIIASTASAYKFAASVNRALGLPKDEDDFKSILRLEKATGVPVPKALQGIENKEIKHELTINVEEMPTAVRRILV